MSSRWNWGTIWGAVGAIAAVVAVVVAILAWRRPIDPSSPNPGPTIIDTSVAQASATGTPTPEPTDTPVSESTHTLVRSPTHPPTLSPTLGKVAITGDTLRLTDPVQMEFVRVPAGELLMGSDRSGDRDAYDNELPQHPVDLPEFYLGKHEVTNVQYADFVEATGHRVPEDWENGRVPCCGLEEHPVVNVSWHDAVAFTQWLSDETGMTFRLPTEAEWEKACRGTEGAIYPWRSEFACTKGNFDDEAEFDPYVVPGGEGCDGYVTTAPVGSYEDGVSPYGVLDIAGNVGEWTTSLWGKDEEKPEFGYPYDPTDGREDEETPDSVLRVVRGGSFGSGGSYVRCAARLGYYPNFRYRIVGFRVAASP